jgi:hypothetical protein
MKSGSVHKVLVHSIVRLGIGQVDTVIASDQEFLEEIDLVGFDCFLDDAEDCEPPDEPGLWIGDFKYREDEECWVASRVSDWVRLTTAQAEALAQGKTFAEVVAA